MNSKLILVLAICVFPTIAVAQTIKTNAVAYEIFDPMNMFQSSDGPIGTVLSFGTIACPGTQPTGSPLQPCPAGSRTNLRGGTMRSRLVSPDQWLNGWFVVEGNADLNANATGHAWGKFSLELQDGGVWEGSWTGDRTQLETLGWATSIRGVGRGSSGSVMGKHLQFRETIFSFAPVTIAYTGDLTAEIIEPPVE